MRVVSAEQDKTLDFPERLNGDLFWIEVPPLQRWNWEYLINMIDLLDSKSLPNTVADVGCQDGRNIKLNILPLNVS